MSDDDSVPVSVDDGAAAAPATSTTDDGAGSPALALSSSAGNTDDDYPVDRKRATMILSLSAEQRFALYVKWEPYDVESWYTALARYTFPSVFVPLSADVARCFLKNSRDLTAEDCSLFDGLAAEINRAIHSLSASSPNKKQKYGVFVRLNTRSPKDATIRNHERLYSFLVPEFEKINSLDDRNSTIVALRRGFGRAMRVESGEEAMTLLRTSERIAEDIRMAHEFIDRRWPLQVVIREWNEVPLEYEMRGFVYDGKLNALSQYNYDCYFPSLHHNIHQIETQIRAFWDMVSKEKVFPFDHAIVDFGIVGEPGKQRVVIIECNPFDAYTGPALFDWEKDWEVLTNGPFQTRIITQVDKVRQAQRVAYEGWLPEIEEATKRAQEKRHAQHQQQMLAIGAGAAVVAAIGFFLWREASK